ncbi:MULTISPECIES: SNF2-related protein [unclassified Tenacibaculum]|uniref:SNF2-related protein n=1 Tax=unclassified Tenacibaculum TaxID=2635139 RepID=UPI001F36E9A3|nr:MULTISPECIES: SNF2-related protein [unclassified Tenacibaculum]MCF2873818.1 SNF2-related protein [Tenacibaculum sp. Cn5-1]MCF2933974.1 SNF2-related protein [Tenacibaculum sp. Cn5-34]MCG7509444.1 SNF2-related protein [Tenacibaculum sp. Cn5-46]
MKGSQTFLDFKSPPEPYLKWPEQFDFPINLDYPERQVEEILLNDILESKNFIILTGFTSLSYLIDCFGKVDTYTRDKKIKIVLGFEPNLRGRKKYHTKSLDKEIAEFWLKKGLSITKGGSVISLIEKIKEEIVEVKFYNKLHGKIYASETVAMIGSSNFSNNGLKKQTEANLRVLADDDKVKYNGIKTIAYNYFHKASKYNDIIELLEKIISPVDWQDALARAISEVLEGNWLEDYQILKNKLENANLWPTQYRGLTQALTILQENSNVLIADPTGAGKTKLCSTIILALENWLFENGRMEKANSVIVCPPLVIEKWKKEFRELSTISNNQISNGTLSNGKLKKLRIAEKELDLANILAIDEAHNYLNIKSKRSIAIRKNNADYKLLITATPINKKVDDLLKIVELLDIDNLDDESFESFKNLKIRPNLKKPKDIQKLKNFVSKFTVRRTKKNINDQIDLEPHLYKNSLGKQCRFPTQISKTYKTEETTEDIEIIKQINSICRKLKGITYLKKINKPHFDIKDKDKQTYIDHRLLVAKSLSIYVIRYRLRSSKIALLEHIIGHEEIQEYEQFPSRKNKENKVKLSELDKLIEKEKLPYVSNMFKQCKLPDWMKDLDTYKKACREERDNYSRISELTKKLTRKREEGKALTLIKQIETNHNKIIAFDSCIISLFYIKHIIKQLRPEIKVLIASGESEKETEEVLDKFDLTSENKEKIIALCSDKMSEGVDLQRASAITLLDLPSVIRIVEQRFGRIDRMDTLMPEIEMYWPDDSKEYSLNADKRLFEVADLVKDTIGSNFKLPESLKFKHFSKNSSINKIIKEYEEYELADDSWEGIHDSFQPIIELKQGKNSLIKEEEYRAYIGIDSQVKTGVSFLESKNKWCFISTRGTKNKSPKWYFICTENKDYQVYTDFSKICNLLRLNIGKKQTKVEWNDHYLNYYLDILRNKEIDLLPPKKKRALNVAKEILSKRIKQKKIPLEEKKVIKQLLELFNQKNRHVDYDEFASLWIKFLQPYIDDKRTRNSRSRQPFNFNDLVSSREISKINFDVKKLIKILEEVPSHENIDNKIAACIVGVPQENSSN